MKKIGVLKSLMRLGFATGVVLLTACGGDSKKTQNKVDDANQSNVRMSGIEQELIGLGVYLGNPAATEARLDTMNPATLNRANQLLTEFIALGQRINDTAARGDVSVKDPQRLELIRRVVGVAAGLRMAVGKALNQPGRGGAECDPRGRDQSLAVARAAAQEFVSGLSPRIAKNIDFDSARVELVQNSCNQARVNFAHLTRSQCQFNVIVEQGVVSREESSQRFECVIVN